MFRKDPSHDQRKCKPRALRRRGGLTETGYQQLEARQLLAVAKVSLKSGLLSILSDHAATNVQLSISGSKLVVADQVTGKSWKYNQSKVQSINFQGGNGDDRFVSLATSIPVTARGGAGNDQLFGGSGNDELYGDAGNDTLHGLAGSDRLFGGIGSDVLSAGAGDDYVWGDLGNDWIYGGGGHDRLMGDSGNDRIFGDDGNDILWGGDGNDTLVGNLGDDQLVGGLGDDHLNGQAGLDRLWGQEGNDTLIGIDGGTSDYLEGGVGRDVIWRDRMGASSDYSPGLIAEDKAHDVWEFDNGADLTLDGDRIADPALRSGLVYKNFSGPLFSSSGPQLTDTLQGSLGDCYLIAGLGAMAYDVPQTLRANMVDFNDGTYGVCLGGEYYRVDGDLPAISVTAATPAFAKLGAEGSLWVAIAEKAFTHYRSSADSYVSIESGWQWEVYLAFGAVEGGHRPFTSFSSAAQLVNQLHFHWSLYHSTSIGFVGLVSNSFGLIMNHAYVVHSFQWNSAGAITSVTLRNPWGVDGSSRDSNAYDGLVTLTADELFALRGNCWINTGRFA